MLPLKTPEEVRAKLQELGVSVKDWSEANGLPPAVVWKVLRGELKCTRGASHKAAVMLGMKRGGIPPGDLAAVRFVLGAPFSSAGDRSQDRIKATPRDAGSPI